MYGKLKGEEQGYWNNLTLSIGVVGSRFQQLLFQGDRKKLVGLKKCDNEFNKEKKKSH